MPPEGTELLGRVLRGAVRGPHVCGVGVGGPQGRMGARGGAGGGCAAGEDVPRAVGYAKSRPGSRCCGRGRRVGRRCCCRRVADGAEGSGLFFDGLEHEFGDFFAAHEHAAEDGAHAEAAADAVGGHAGDEEAGVDFFGVVDGGALAFGGVHAHFSDDAAGGGVEADVVFAGDGAGDFTVVPGGVEDGFGDEGEGVDVQAFAQDGGPVDDDAADAALLVDDVFDGVAVEDGGAGLGGAVEEAGGGVDGVDDAGAVAVGAVGEAEFFDDGQGFLLDDDVVEHHGAAPHAAAGGEFAIEQGDFAAGFGEVVGGDDAGGAAADDGGVELEAGVEFGEVGFDDAARDEGFHNGGWSVCVVLPLMLPQVGAAVNPQGASAEGRVRGRGPGCAACGGGGGEWRWGRWDVRHR